MISCPIQDITVQPYFKQQNGTWYPIQLKLSDGRMLEIQHQYADFIQFSRLIRQQFNLSRAELPKIKKQHNFLKKRGAQKYHQRQCELQDFCRLLLLLPPVVTCSPVCLSFFSATPEIGSVSNSLKRAFSLKPSGKKQQQQQHLDLVEMEHAFSRSLVMSIGQHEHQLQQCTSRPNIQSINKSNRCSTTSTTSTASSSILFSSSLSSTEEDDTIKLKIIYDAQNIIIIRVARSVSLDQLRSQVTQKFALINIMLPDQLVLRTVDCARYSSGSGSSIVCSAPADSDLNAEVLIANEQDLSRAMLLKWNTLQKVTLRCVV
ncbi:uncharacterized protein ATC70_010369 [Mucor velutinosus]|uniref:PX domain-containing protein n=1 Tax=Mucor velutinosus TaxID=708070 RepID=A0AAN7DEL1_9FUNG|nr:hypothetical protein ATC70_010369 [Mucor velutinosus]